MKKALDIIKGLTAEPEVGAIYKGTVKRITDFGAFVEILPGTDGLLHISEIAHTRVERVDGRHEGGRHRRGEGPRASTATARSASRRRELLPLPEGEEGERAKARIQQAREDGGRPPRRDGGGGRGDRRGPPRGR